MPGKISETTSIFCTERVLYSPYLKSAELVTYDRHMRRGKREVNEGKEGRIETSDWLSVLLAKTVS